MSGYVRSMVVKSNLNWAVGVSNIELLVIKHSAPYTTFDVLQFPPAAGALLLIQ